jgi:hypothetical protein
MITSPQDEKVAIFFWLSATKQGTEWLYSILGIQPNKNGATLLSLPNREHSHSILRNWDEPLRSTSLSNQTHPKSTIMGVVESWHQLVQVGPFASMSRNADFYGKIVKARTARGGHI